MEWMLEHSMLMLIIAGAVGFLMAWGVGANDVANAMGTSVGAGALTVGQAVMIAIVFEFAGAYLAGGEVTITGTPTGRDVSGTVAVQSARFNLDNLPSSRAQAIDVRWKENGDAPSAQSALRQSLTLDIAIMADRRVYVDGRGLESEWGADLKLSGTAASPRLNGTATMRRGPSSTRD